MARKIERALTNAQKRAKQYVLLNEHMLKDLYYLSNSQLEIVEKVFRDAFMEGVNFK